MKPSKSEKAGRSRQSASQSSATNTQPPTLPETAKNKEEKIQPTQENCFGRRKYAEVVVESIKPRTHGDDKSSSFSLEPSSTSSSIHGDNQRASSHEPQGS